MPVTAFPAFASPSITVTTQPRTVPYEGSYVWDFARGDFALDGAGKTIPAEGYHAWVQWCVKAVLTERFSSPILHPDYGTEVWAKAIGQHQAVAQEVIARTIREALMFDERTGSVGAFSFSRNGDQLYVDFDITPTVGTAVRVSIALGPF